jgi:hypothetical protein
MLKGEVQVAMQLSRFASRCSGKEIKLVFMFTLTDPPVDSVLPPAVQFVPPNRFELTFRRLRANVDPVSPPKPAAGR